MFARASPYLFVHSTHHDPHGPPLSYMIAWPFISPERWQRPAGSPLFIVFHDRSIFVRLDLRNTRTMDIWLVVRHQVVLLVLSDMSGRLAENPVVANCLRPLDKVWLVVLVQTRYWPLDDSYRGSLNVHKVTCNAAIFLGPPGCCSVASMSTFKYSCNWCFLACSNI